jgi:peptidoglycan/xylan/chitin deacetylase (PgdA/CDA1 family)
MARVARQIAPRTVVKALFAPLKIEYEPPEAYVEYPGNAKGACCISVDFDVTSPERYKPNQAGTLALLDLSDRFDVPLTWAVCGKDAEKDSATYLKIRQADTCQEIGVHTYSHLDASTCSAAELEADIQHCIQVLDLRSTPKVFVFPWNREGHFETIRRIGFMTYRGKRRAIAPPRKENSLWNIAPVFYLDQ